jgi:hypothetical protein
MAIVGISKTDHSTLVGTAFDEGHDLPQVRLPTAHPEPGKI